LLLLGKPTDNRVASRCLASRAVLRYTAVATGRSATALHGNIIAPTRVSVAIGVNDVVGDSGDGRGRAAGGDQGGLCPDGNCIVHPFEAAGGITFDYERSRSRH